MKYHQCRHCLKDWMAFVFVQTKSLQYIMWIPLAKWTDVWWNSAVVVGPLNFVWIRFPHVSWSKTWFMGRFLWCCWRSFLQESQRIRPPTWLTTCLYRLQQWCTGRLGGRKSCLKSVSIGKMRLIRPRHQKGCLSQQGRNGTPLVLAACKQFL